MAKDKSRGRDIFSGSPGSGGAGRIAVTWEKVWTQGEAKRSLNAIYHSQDFQKWELVFQQIR